MAVQVKAGECVLLAGMEVKGAGEFGIGEEHICHLVTPEAALFKAKRAYKDSAEVLYVVSNGAWIVKAQGRPLEFRAAPSTPPKTTHIGLKDSTVLGLVGFVGSDVEFRDGTYTVPPEFQKRIGLRNPCHFG